MTESAAGSSSNRQERFPDRHLFRSFRIAVHIPQVLIAAVAVFVLASGLWVVDRLPFAPDPPKSECFLARPLASGWNAETRRITPEAIPHQLAMVWSMLTLPVRSVIEPAADLFVIGNTWSDAAYAWTRLFWALAVWAFFGAVITRIAAVRFANDQTVGLTTALGFAGKRFLSYFTSPLLPTAGILFFWMLLLVGGWIASIPAVGPALAGIFWVLALLLGLLITLTAVGVLAGWPLMAPTISTEVSDGFDGFSRSFSYVYSRPWPLARLYLLASFCGVVGVALVVAIACAVVHVAVWGVASGFGNDSAAYLTHETPFAIYDLSSTEQATGEAAVSGFAASAARFWLQAAAVLVHGFAVSLFWSLMTLAYFAIRNIDDATAMDEVFLTEAEQKETGLPDIGVPELDAPMTERPLDKDPGGREAESDASTDDGESS